MDIHLPSAIRAKCDLSSVRIEQGSYIDGDLKRSCSDIVYGLNLLDKPDELLYVLVEHQSSAEELMPFRILSYQVRIIDYHLYNKGKGSKKLPLVVPLVFYNGTKSPYAYPYDIAELFECKELYASIPLGVFKLIDLTVMSDDEITRHKKIALLEAFAKHIHQRNFSAACNFLVEIVKMADAIGIGRDFITSAFTYIGDAREEEEVKPLFTEIAKNVPHYEEFVMSYAETLRQEGVRKGRQEGLQEGLQKGLQKGLQEGKQEGLQKGKQEERREIAQQLLESGIDEDIIEKVTHLTKQQLKQLKKALH